MFLILLSWIYIGFTTINIGFFTNKILGLKNSNFVIFSILGLFTTTLFAGFWAIFERINIEFHIIFLILNIGIYLKFKNSIKSIYKSFFYELLCLPISLKTALSIISILILAQCASIPFIIDNESYYIQTIKWINKYGFVEGVANLHFFLAQTSGWHITQSVFNFSFLYNKFNDLSGFCLLLGNVYAFLHLNSFFKSKKINHLLIGFLPFANIFFFSFISTPSPDLPVYVLSLIIFYKFINNYKNLSPETFNLIAVLVFFAVFIKTTAIILIFIPVALFSAHYQALVSKLTKSLLLGIMVLFLFLIKNTIISGYPLFPLTFHLFSFDFQIPASMVHTYYGLTKRAAYELTENQFNSLNVFEISKIWLSRRGLHGFFNKTILLLLLSIPVFVFKYFNKKSFWILYIILFLQLLFLFFTSPQYRFFINAILFFSFLIAASYINTEKKIVFSMYFSLIILTLPTIFTFDLSFFTKNTHLKNNSTFSVNQIIFPYKNSKFEDRFEMIKNGNLKYSSPINIPFFWGTGDGEIPCVNKDQIKYFETYYNVKPQMRTNNLKDGFFSKKLSKNE
ncbi:hypothetical protein DMB65_10655 [Flavobacterium cheongpyeongense]|uniref:DUF8201 domain-containing protein n=1 Tax=Flavobacterium cheongpyeongense TaxID=2212651 RepID=A0A2V4BNV8_9FLAO|nr:hypothetical protein [Flavobacterium cheongpyeongense]PXY40688.1 hypothetical protein DMB65_10655 [Flavobacterium cheongpyeongense]